MHEAKAVNRLPVEEQEKILSRLIVEQAATEIGKKIQGTVSGKIREAILGTDGKAVSDWAAFTANYSRTVTGLKDNLGELIKQKEAELAPKNAQPPAF